MAFSTQRILKSKYIAYRYFDSIYKNYSTGYVLPFDQIQKDALNKVNLLTGESNTCLEHLTEETKEMYDSNLKMSINTLVEVTSPPAGKFYSEFKLFSLKNNDKNTPPVFIFNKKEMCMYIITLMRSYLSRNKYNYPSDLMRILTERKICDLVGLNTSAWYDERAYAENQLGYISSSYKEAVYLRALDNCGKLELIIEYLLCYKKDRVLNLLYKACDSDYVYFQSNMVTCDNNYYYVVPYSNSPSDAKKTKPKSTARTIAPSVMPTKGVTI